MNKFLFAGILGNDPEVKQLKNGAVTKFNVRITEEFTKMNGESGESILWVNCEAWSSLGEVCADRLRAGDYCKFEGKLVTEQWEGKNGKKFRYIIKLISFKKGYD